MPQIRVDLHCDSLTASPPLTGLVKPAELTQNTFQCFAIFTNENAAAYAAAKALFYAVFSQKRYAIVKNYGDYLRARALRRVPCALTCENIGFTGGDPAKTAALRADGAIMASLVWNEENALAFPNVRADGKREKRGLKKRGFAALAALDKNKIIVDISHLSDGGVAQILKNRKIPVVASHSCADAVCRNLRNLTDGQLRGIAECGGAVGVNFYKRFLGGAGGFAEISAHIKHIIAVAGEDAPAFGSDWDGTLAGGIAVCPCDMAELMRFLLADGITERQLEKIAFKNFLRVFKEVCS